MADDLKYSCTRRCDRFGCKGRYQRHQMVAVPPARRTQWIRDAAVDELDRQSIAERMHGRKQCFFCPAHFDARQYAAYMSSKKRGSTLPAEMQPIAGSGIAMTPADDNSRDSTPAPSVVANEVVVQSQQEEEEQQPSPPPTPQRETQRVTRKRKFPKSVVERQRESNENAIDAPPPRNGHTENVLDCPSPPRQPRLFPIKREIVAEVQPPIHNLTQAFPTLFHAPIKMELAAAAGAVQTCVWHEEAARDFETQRVRAAVLEHHKALRRAAADMESVVNTQLLENDALRAQLTHLTAEHKRVVAELQTAREQLAAIQEQCPRILAAFARFETQGKSPA